MNELDKNEILDTSTLLSVKGYNYTNLCNTVLVNKLVGKKVEKPVGQRVDRPFIKKLSNIVMMLRSVTYGVATYDLRSVETI